MRYGEGLWPPTLRNAPATRPHWRSLLEGSLAAARACLTIRHCSCPHGHTPADKAAATACTASEPSGSSSWLTSHMLLVQFGFPTDDFWTDAELVFERHA